jgi:hypothetical protein
VGWALSPAPEGFRMASIGLDRGVREATRVLRDEWDLRLVSVGMIRGRWRSALAVYVADCFLRRAVARTARSWGTWGPVLVSLTWRSWGTSLVAGLGVLGPETVGVGAMARHGGLGWVPGGGGGRGWVVNAGVLTCIHTFVWVWL